MTAPVKEWHWGSMRGNPSTPELVNRLNVKLNELSSAVNHNAASDDFYNVLWYGAKGNGLADDTAAVQSAINAAFANGGGVVYFPAGTYRIVAQLTLRDQVELRGASRLSVTIDCSASSVTSGPTINGEILGQGSITALPALSGVTVAKDSRSITFASAPTLNQDDLVILTSTDLWSSARSYYNAGEMLLVDSVAGAVVATETPLIDSYTVANLSAYRMTPIRCRISSLNFIFKPGVFGLHLIYCRGCSIEDVSAHGTNVAQFCLNHGFDVHADRVFVHDYTAAIGENYAIDISNCQRWSVTNSILSTRRHGLTTGGGAITGNIITREGVIADNVISGLNPQIAGLDLHGNSEYISITGNVLPNGLVVGGDFITVSGNSIRTTTDDPQAEGIYVTEAKGCNFTIVGNSIWATGDLTGASSGMVHAHDFDVGDRPGTFVVEGNNFYFGSHIGYGVYLFNQVVTTAFNCRIANNAFYYTDPTTLTDKYAVWVRGHATNADKGWQSVQILGNQLQYGTIRLQQPNARLLHVRANQSSLPSRDALLLLANTAAYPTGLTEQIIEIDDNYFYKPGASGVNLAGDFDGSLTSVFVRRNTAINTCQGGSTGSSSTDSSIRIKNANLAVVADNLVGKSAGDGGSQSRTYGFDTITDLYLGPNSDIGSLSSNYTAVTNLRGLKFPTMSGGGTINRAIETGADEVKLGGTLQVIQTMSLRAAPSTATAILVDPGLALSGASSHFGVKSDATIGSDCTGTAIAEYARLRTQAAAWTLTAGEALRAASPVIGSGSAITNTYGLHIEDQVGGSTTSRGLVIDSQTGTGAKAIQTGTGVNEFGDAVKLTVAGAGLFIKEGTNATMGSAVLVGGTVTVSTTKVTANSRIFLTINAPGGTLGSVYVSARTAGTSFVITSTSVLDTSAIGWLICEPS